MLAPVSSVSGSLTTTLCALRARRELVMFAAPLTLEPLASIWALAIRPARSRPGLPGSPLSPCGPRGPSVPGGPYAPRGPAGPVTVAGLSAGHFGRRRLRPLDFDLKV